MFCGRRGYRPQTLALALQDLFTSFGELLSTRDIGEWHKTTMLRMGTFIQTWLNHELGKPMQLQELMYMTYGHFEASDPRDNVFALIGLASGEHQDLINYDLTTGRSSHKP
jgi:hypothetical protein